MGGKEGGTEGRETETMAEKKKGNSLMIMSKEIREEALLGIL